MAIIRGVRDRRFKFTQCLNSMYDDSNISLKAKGFIGCCLRKYENSSLLVTEFASELKEGEKAIYSVINECLKNGYGFRYQPRNEKGVLLPVEFIISDSKEEIISLRKDIESTPDFKKCLPLRPFREADNRHAETNFKKCLPLRPFRQADNRHADNGEAVSSWETPKENEPPIYNNTYCCNTKEQEQEQQQPAAVSSKNRMPQTIIHPILKDVDIPINDKAWLSKHYPEEQVAQAIKWSQHPSTKINKELSAALKWACKARPTIPEEKVNGEPANKSYAYRYDEMESTTSRVYVSHKGVEFVNKCNPSNSSYFSFDSNGFMEQFKNALRKSGFKILQ